MLYSTALDVDATLDTIKAMRFQEASAYQVCDYLSDLPKRPLHSHSEAPVDEVCRRMMAKWCGDICDFCKYSRETVAITMNCLDRFMATEDGHSILMDRGQYQLAAMTALYTSVKIHEHEAMDPSLVSSLSRGAHSAEAVEAMEGRLLQAVQWRVNPPTASSFLSKMVSLVPEYLIRSEEDRETLLELANFQADLAISDYRLAQEPSSKLALAALLNALENLSTEDMVVQKQLETTLSTCLSMAAGLDLSGLWELRVSLYESLSGGSALVALGKPTESPSHSRRAPVPTATSADYHLSPRTTVHT